MVVTDDRPTLTYFDFAGGRGEDCRIALHLAGVAFHDRRIPFDQWPDIRAEAPFGTLPFFTVPGRGTIGQSNAILRYIGALHGLHPCDPWEAARHEAILCAVEDLRHLIGPTFEMADLGARRALRERFAREEIPAWARQVEAAIGGGPFVAGEVLQVADLKLWMVVRWLASGILEHVPTDVLGVAPGLARHARAVAAHPGVRSWSAG